MILALASQWKHGQTWCSVSVRITNPSARLLLIMAYPMRQSGVFFVVMARKEQDKPFSFPLPVFEED